jgi:hypothetical protein
MTDMPPSIADMVAQLQAARAVRRDEPPRVRREPLQAPDDYSALRARMMEPLTLEGGDDEATQQKPRRKRRADPIRLVKRAIACGLNVKTVNYTTDGVSMTLADSADVSRDDPNIIETPEQLRRLI